MRDARAGKVLELASEVFVPRYQEQAQGNGVIATLAGGNAQTERCPSDSMLNINHMDWMRWFVFALIFCNSLVAVEPTPSPAAATSAGMGVVPPPGYRLIPGDLVRVEVYDNPDLTVQFRVPAVGGVTFPLVGDLPALAGITTDELTTTISKRLATGFLRNPQVQVVMIEYSFVGVYVVGSVHRPGTVRLVPGQEMTLLQAIGEAGGFSEEANRLSVRLVRAGAGREVVDGGNLERGDAALLRPGDVVVVPRSDRVYVLGRVQRPGALELPTQGRLTVSKAISMAGGFERFARDGAVQLLRGAERPVTIDVEAVLAGKDGHQDPVLQPGDTVFVPESRF